MYFADLVTIFTLKLPSLKSAGSLQSFSVVAKNTGKVEVFSQHSGLHPKPASNHLPVRIDLTS